MIDTLANIQFLDYLHTFTSVYKINGKVVTRITEPEPNGFRVKSWLPEVKTINLVTPEQPGEPQVEALKIKLIAKPDPSFESLFRDSEKATKVINLLKQEKYIDSNEVWIKENDYTHIVSLYAALLENEKILHERVGNIKINKTLLKRVFCKKFGIKLNAFSDETGRNFFLNMSVIERFKELLSKYNLV